jgi:UDP-N-acetylmuramate dehydrogenase
VSSIEALLAGGVVSEQVPLGPLTTYKAGGPARYLATPGTVAELRDLIDTGVFSDLEVLVLGRGSNLVVADEGFDGIVVHLEAEFARVSVEGTTVTAGGAAPLARVARTAVDAGVLGLEFFVGIPGSVGGAVRQNAGCFGVETSDRLIDAELIDVRTGQERSTGPVDLDLGYRHSNVRADEVVITARFAGSRGEVSAGKTRMREITRWRKENQPGGTLNAGSVFKNPAHESAGELIDRLGLKGTRVGGVAVSDKHANFFVAGPGATATDIYRLVGLVKDTVFERSGTMLEPEIQFVGFEE